MTGMATTKDWLNAKEAGGMTLTTYDPACVMSQPSVSHSTEVHVAEVPLHEMRPARRSLSDKAREEMSDFDRKYPW